MNNWDQIANNGKVWLYGAKRRLLTNELRYIDQALSQFCREWAAHGEKLNCGFQIKDEQFILIAVDEGNVTASGCSIDSSVGLIKNIDKQFDLDLFNRLRVYHMDDGNLETTDLHVARENIGIGKWRPNDLIINTTALKKEAIENEWLLPISKSWLSKYLV
jgi:hypothetical protein